MTYYTNICLCIYIYIYTYIYIYIPSEAVTLCLIWYNIVLFDII